MLIAGPTASGKSALALNLAQQTGGVIINADALQVYRDLRVLTARPTQADEAKATHRLYGTLEATCACSAAYWAELATSEIESSWASGQLPIVVGGTGLYLRTLLEGIAPVPDIPEDIRETVRRELHADGPEALHQRLTTLDPAGAAHLNPRDKQRIARALEVVLATGCPLRDLQTQSTGGLAHRTDIGPIHRFALMPDRAALYERCNQRFASMLDQGALTEVEHLLAQDLDPHLPIHKAVGVKELAEYITGRLSLEEALAAASQSTRRYAKRQYTWLRHQFSDWQVLNALELQTLQEKIAIILRETGLTLK